MTTSATDSELLCLDGLLPLLRNAYQSGWSGAVRTRREGQIGAIWLVKGQVVHCLSIAGPIRIEGIAALEDMVTWPTVTILLDAPALPPARSIRQPMTELLDTLTRLATAQSEESAKRGHEERNELDLDSLFKTLRQRVPELEAISVANGKALERTTLSNAEEKRWLTLQLQTHFFDRQEDPDRLYLQQGDHALLIMKRGALSAVLMARNEAAPEALFWAGEEAHRHMGTTERRG
jgi:hypothetical protein